MPRICIKSVTEQAHYVNTIKYVAKREKRSKMIIGASNVYLPMVKKDIVPAIREQFDAVKTFYGKEDCRLGIHFEINFAPEELEYLDAWKILGIGYWISEMEFSNCMTYFGVHDHSDYMHLDMLINPVLISNGNMFGCGNNGWIGIGNRLCEYMKNYMPEESLSDLQVAFPD